jgi:uncharacterized protein YbjT (DUF2867 family)
MKVIVFGATGGTGRLTARGLVAAGHQVTAFARTPAALAGETGLTVVQGDVMAAAPVAAAVAGQEAVVVCLGNSQNPFAMMLGAKRTTPADVCAVGTRHIIAGMQAAGVQRLLVVTAFGIGDNRDKMPFAFKLFYKTVLREHMADKDVQEAAVKACSLNWVLIQPVGLTDGPATHTWLASPTGALRRQQISRADVAAYLVGLVASGGNTRETVALSG